MSRFNHSSLFEETNIRPHLVKTMNLIHRLSKDPAGRSARTLAAQLASQFQTTSEGVQTLKSSEIPSLSAMLEGKFSAVKEGIGKVDASQSEHIHSACLRLCTSLDSLSKACPNLLATFNESTEENEEYFVSLVRRFLKQYNSNFYSVFSKSALTPGELAALKSDMLSLCNKAITGLRAVFSFFPDLRKIRVNMEAAQKIIDDYSQHLRYLAAQNQVLDPLQVFTDGQDTYLIARVNAFIQSLGQSMKRSFDSGTISDQLGLIEAEIRDTFSSGPSVGDQKGRLIDLLNSRIDEERKKSEQYGTLVRFKWR